jgi:hypothetical protein
LRDLRLRDGSVATWLHAEEQAEVVTRRIGKGVVWRPRDLQERRESDRIRALEEIGEKDAEHLTMRLRIHEELPRGGVRFVGKPLQG